MCKVLKFPRSTYYEAIRKTKSKRQLEAAKFKDKIKDIYIKSKCRYGAPKIQKVLESRGEHISLKRVQRYMSATNLFYIVIKKSHPLSSKSNIKHRGEE